MKSLNNKVAIITGAASGIGKAIARKFAEEGAKVVVSDIDEESGNKVIDKIEEDGGKALFVNADTSKPKDHKKLIEKTVDHFGQLDIAVNNAGISGPQKPAGEYPADGWDNIIAISLSGVFYGIHEQVPAMLESGGGSIINMASILGQVGTPGAAGYVAAKHGVVGLTKTVALDYADQNIRVNAVGPGYIKTPLLDDIDDEEVDQLVSLHPMGRLGKAEEIAELVLWLASEKASFATGSYYPVDGGYLAQ